MKSKAIICAEVWRMKSVISEPGERNYFLWHRSGYICIACQMAAG